MCARCGNDTFRVADSMHITIIDQVSLFCSKCGGEDAEEREVMLSTLTKGDAQNGN